jgi:hypothetical protein
MENSMLQFLQILFSTFPKDCFHYDSEDGLTDIKIEGRNTDNLKEIDTRPKIVVYRGPVAWENRGLGNFVGSKNLSLENRGYTDVLNGSVSINCFSREPLEADRIANICFDSIKMFRSKLQQFGFLSIRSAQAGQRGMIKSDARTELFVTPVLVEVQITKNWQNTIVDPVKLRQVLIQFTYGN